MLAAWTCVLSSMWGSIQYDWIINLWNGTSPVEDGLKFWQSEYLKNVFTVTVLMAKTSETGNCNSCCCWSWSLQHSSLGEPALFSHPPEKALAKKKAFCAVTGRRWGGGVPPTVSRWCWELARDKLYRVLELERGFPMPGRHCFQVLYPKLPVLQPFQPFCFFHAWGG